MEMIEFGTNSFAMTGGARAVREAAAAPVELVFVPESVEEMKPVTFSYGPAAPGVTTTVTVQVAFDVTFGASDPFTSWTPEAPAARAPPEPFWRVPPQVFVVVSGEATVRFAGKASVNRMPVRVPVDVLFRFVTVNVSVEVRLTATGFGEKFFWMVR